MFIRTIRKELSGDSIVDFFLFIKYPPWFGSPFVWDSDLQQIPPYPLKVAPSGWKKTREVPGRLHDRSFPLQGTHLPLPSAKTPPLNSDTNRHKSKSRLKTLKRTRRKRDPTIH